MIRVVFAPLRNGCNWSAASSILFSSKYSTFCSSVVPSLAEVSSTWFKFKKFAEIMQLFARVGTKHGVTATPQRELTVAHTCRCCTCPTPVGVLAGILKGEWDVICDIISFATVTTFAHVLLSFEFQSDTACSILV